MREVSPEAAALTRMRECAAKAHEDVEAGVSGAADRFDAFVQACTQLSGGRWEDEVARATRAPQEQPWQYS